ncbi:MFS general substrate transporter [Aspergillus falconensis]
MKSSAVSDSSNNEISEATPEAFQIVDGWAQNDDEEQILRRPSPLPNGGWLAWTQVAGSWCLMFNCWGIPNSYGVFQTYYESEMLAEHTSSSIAWIGSIQIFLLLFIGALTGPLYDHGYFRLLLAAGTVLMVLGMILLSLCSQFWHFILAQGIAVGLGAGCLFIPSVAVLPMYFSSHVAFSIGVAGSGSGFGGIIYPIAFQRLVAYLGFGWAVRVLGFISLATLLFPLLVMRVRSPTSGPELQRTVRKLFDSSALREPPFCLFLLWAFFGFAGVYMPLFYVGSYAIEKRIMSSRLAFYLLPILHAGSVLGRIIPNYAADKTGPVNMFVPTCLGLTVLSFAWVGIHNTAGLITFVVFYGILIGTFMTLPFSAVIKLSPHLGVTGVRMGMLCIASSIGILIGAPVGGAVLHRGGWISLQVFGATALVVATIAVLACRIAKVGVSPWEKV